MTKATLTQARDDNHDHAEDKQIAEILAAIERDWVFLNCNLQNYPLARDRHCKLNWKPVEDGRWICELTDNIQLSYPATVEPKLAPSAFDFNVLLWLLRLRRLTGRPDLRVTRKELRKAIDVARGGDGDKRLQAALHLWSHISISFKHWHEGGKAQSHVLPPPISKLDPHRRQLQIEMNDAWYWVKGYCTRVPVPLPHDAAAQNLLLYLFTQPGKTGNQIRRGKRKLEFLYRTLGLTHTNNRRTMERAVELTDRWLNKHGGEFKAWFKAGLFRFQVTLPERKKKQKQSLKRKRLDAPRTSIKQHWTLDEFKQSKEFQAGDRSMSMAFEKPDIPYDNTGIEWDEG